MDAQVVLSLMKALGFLALLVPVCAAACINDRDTLAFELRNVDALHRITSETDRRKKAAAIQELALRAIGGRFERYPALYYQMRIDRLLNKASLTAAEYDDLAVAYDRLSNVDQAIRTILDSRSRRTTEDDDYRFHANYGTFLVHRWIVNGHKAADAATLKQSIAEIKAALAINPDSHFGRERVQLALEESWLPDSDGTTVSLLHRIDLEAALVGLSGIVMMGLGYELPDVYLAMANSYIPGQAGHSLLQPLANLRLNELIGSGKTLIDPKAVFHIHKNPEGVGEYRLLRADGERVYQARLAYMNPRLARGDHPDTDPAFWAEWQEPPQPVLNRIPTLQETYYSVLWTSVVALVALAVGFEIWRKRRRRDMQA